MAKISPVMRWDPKTGESKVLNNAAEVPKGWLDHHPKDPAYPAQPAAGQNPVVAKLPDPTPAAPTMTRDQIIAELEKREVAYYKNSPTSKLQQLLNDLPAAE